LSVYDVCIEKNSLEILASRANEEGLTDRIELVHASILDLAFPAHTFEIIWNEGAINTIGFRQGLREWRDLLVPEGFLVVHDELTDLPKKIESIHHCGYFLLGKFELSPDIWWNGYYAPLRKQVEAVRATGSPNKRFIQNIGSNCTIG
jgi:ubiquinone/menaquinone biosynthesis C-methylase UbiE